MYAHVINTWDADMYANWRLACFVFLCLNMAASVTAQSSIPMYVNMDSMLMIGLHLFAFLAKITAAFE